MWYERVGAVPKEQPERDIVVFPSECSLKEEASKVRDLMHGTSLVLPTLYIDSTACIHPVQNAVHVPQYIKLHGMAQPLFEVDPGSTRHVCLSGVGVLTQGRAAMPPGKFKRQEEFLAVRSCRKLSNPWGKMTGTRLLWILISLFCCRWALRC
eukprot:scaffold75026_cov23-Tisochrysis_lutea.AAC.1